jgi:hypothetical protein
MQTESSGHELRVLCGADWQLDSANLHEISAAVHSTTIPFAVASMVASAVAHQPSATNAVNFVDGLLHQQNQLFGKGRSARKSVVVVL